MRKWAQHNRHRITNAIIGAMLFPFLYLLLEFGFYKWAPLKFIVNYESQIVENISCLSDRQDVLLIRNAKHDIRAEATHELQYLKGEQWYYFRTVSSQSSFFINAGTEFRAQRLIIPPLPQGEFRWQSTFTLYLPYGIERHKTVISNSFKVICDSNSTTL